MFGPPRARPVAELAAFMLVLGGCSGQADHPGGGLGPGVPQFHVDPLWPQELPNDWILGSVTGVFVDDRDHVWVTHLPETLLRRRPEQSKNHPLGRVACLLLSCLNLIPKEG